MAKRALDDVVVSNSANDLDHTAKKAKRDKKQERPTNSARENKSNGRKHGSNRDRISKYIEDGSNNVDESGIVIPELTKEERKALKRARKEQEKVQAAPGAQNFTNSTGDSDAAAKGEKKARKHAEKGAMRVAKGQGSKAVLEGKGATASMSVAIKTSGAAVATTGYNEVAALTALAKSEVDAFVSKNFITVDNPTAESYRPIIAFKYLPITNETQRAPFASFETPTPIQAAAWPYALAGRDVIGVAETGSGKTLAFGVPCVRYISSLEKNQRNCIKACMVSPTRELALQIHEQLVKLAEPAGLKCTVVYGGVNKDMQRETLKGTHIVVATPGRLNDFIQEESIDLSSVGYMVLDEADRMLDRGFEEDIRKIITSTPSQGRQTLMFTATWPSSVRELASSFMQEPVKIAIGDNPTGELRANAKIVQEVEVIDPALKQQRLIELLKQYQSGKNKKDRILVFCLYKKEATRIEEFIRRRGFNVAGIHGDLSQIKRGESLEAFKNGSVPCLVATDVAARGLDIPAVKVVINVTFPLTVEDYVHRIGRTGRAGQDGLAITFFTDHEKPLAGALINVLKGASQPVPEELMKYGTTVKKKGHEAYGAFYKDAGDMKKATKITFD